MKRHTLTNERYAFMSTLNNDWALDVEWGSCC
jgi:hypothetical protein